MTRFPNLTPEQAAAIVKANPKVSAAIEKATAGFGVSFREAIDRVSPVMAAIAAEQRRRTKRLLEQARLLNV